MCSTNVRELIRFKNGEFPDYLLAPLREIALVLEPFEAAATEAGSPEELLAFFEVLDMDTRLSERFVALVEESGRLFFSYSRNYFQQTSKSTLLGLWKRLGRAVMGIGAKLRDHGRPLTVKVLEDIGSLRSMLEIAMFAKLGKLKEARSFYPEDNREIELCFNWFVISSRLANPARLQIHKDIPAMLDTLRFMQLEFPDTLHGFRCSPSIHAALKIEHVYEIVIRQSNHPWALAQVLVLNPATHKILTVGQISRLTGELTLSDCLAASLRVIFETFDRADAYLLLKEACIHHLYDLVATGRVKERVYMDSEEEPDVVETASAPPAPTEAPRVALIETAPLIVSLPPLVPSTESNAKKLLIGKSRYTWRNIVGALERRGAVLAWGGKHARVEYDGRSAPFLNPHTSNPHHNRRELRRVLMTLGIDEREFMDDL